VRECGAGHLVVYGGGLGLEPRQLPLDVRDEQVGEMVSEAPPHDHAQGGKVLSVLRERVRGHLPAALAKRVDTSNTV
jgi:hypothetical protein